MTTETGMTITEPRMASVAPESDVLSGLAALLSADMLGFTVINREATASGFLTGYCLDLRNAHGNRLRQIVYLETTPPAPERPGVLRFVEEDGEGVIDAWLYPNDPALPALGAAVFPEAAAVVLARLGSPVAAPQLELVAYRPGKRAVVRATGEGRVVFLKVVRPKYAEHIHAAHRAWRSAGVPVPRSLGWAPEGLIALEDLGGAPADVVLPPPSQAGAMLDGIVQLTGSIAEVPSHAPARASLVNRLDWYERRLTALAPGMAERIYDVCGAIRQRIASAPPARTRTIHGDLHLGQLRVDPHDGSITGLLDIDTAGLGDPADDLGAFAGHAIATAALQASLGADSSTAWAEIAGAWIERWPVQDGCAGRGRAITATHLLAHALTGTAETETLLGLAESVLDERALIPTSFLSHFPSGS